MSIRGFEISKGTTGASVSNAEDSISGLLVSGVVVTPSADATGVALATKYEITKLKDAEAMGITADYDATNNVCVHRHIAEFYRLAGEGVKLNIMIVAQSKTMKEMIVDHARSLVVASGRSIRNLSVAYNPATGYTPTYVNGLEANVREAIAEGQALADWSFETDGPLNVFLEGRGIHGSVSSSEDLRNILISSVLLEATNVTLCVSQDWDYADTKTGYMKNMADVGTLLGTKAFIGVSRSVAEVETINLSDAKKGKWLTAGLSNHSTIESLDEDLASYDAKGYVFALAYTGESGFRWNNDHVCSPEGVDDEGYIKISTIAHGTVINKAARKLRTKLLPKVKSSVQVDPATGYLPGSIVKYFEQIADKAFVEMAGEISDGKTFVDATSNLQTGDKALGVTFIVVPLNVIGKIKGVINLKTTL